MPRLLQIFLNITTTLSLILCAAILAIWIRSYFKPDFVTLTHTADGLEIAARSAHGSLYVGPVRHDAIRNKRFLRKHESRKILHVQLLFIAGIPAITHLMIILIRQEKQRRAMLPSAPLDEE